MMQTQNANIAAEQQINQPTHSPLMPPANVYHHTSMLHFALPNIFLPPFGIKHIDVKFAKFYCYKTKEFNVLLLTPTIIYNRPSFHLYSCIVAQCENKCKSYYLLFNYLPLFLLSSITVV